MPQMSKGGKWVFGWCVVGKDQKILIPEEAFLEYGFQAGEPVVFLRGSYRSGGFSVGRLEKLVDGTANLLLRRSVGRGILLEGGIIVIPPGADVQPGDRLLAVRGSGYALLFIKYGQIYDEALRHSGIETFSSP